VGAVGHYLEQEGIATTQISLVREHTEVIRPPRALWVPFMMGRPLGAPNDADFQRRVLLATLQLLEEPSGPVLREFPDDAPGGAESEEEGAACPVNFSTPRVSGAGEHELAQALGEEIAQLQPWHDLALRRRGGGTSGLSGLTAEAAGAFVVAFLSDHRPENFRPAQPLGLSLKQACDDLRAFYEEAATAQPGSLSAAQLEDWYYFGTIAGEVLRELYRACLASDEKGLRLFAELTLLPRGVVHKMQAGAPRLADGA
jgi:hypothetical protein